MKKKKVAQKLQFKSEQVRILTDQQMAAVAGATGEWTSFCWSVCDAPWCKEETK
jgi:hypothetical protein